MRDKLLAAGVRQLKESYPAVTNENILTDMIYSAFFLEMLKSTKGNGRDLDSAIDALILEIEASKQGVL